MTPLPAIIGKAGFELRRVKRVGRVAIYRQHLPGANPDHDAYEVVLVQVRDTNHRGEPVGAYEGYPSAESWGKKGWTFTNLDKAFQKLLQLRKRATQKASRTGTVSRRNRFDGQGSPPRGWFTAQASGAILGERQFHGHPLAKAARRHYSNTEGVTRSAIRL